MTYVYIDRIEARLGFESVLIMSRGICRISCRIIIVNHKPKDKFIMRIQKEYLSEDASVSELIKEKKHLMAGSTEFYRSFMIKTGKASRRAARTIEAAGSFIFPGCFSR